MLSSTQHMFTCGWAEAKLFQGGKEMSEQTGLSMICETREEEKVNVGLR